MRKRGPSLGAGITAKRGKHCYVIRAPVGTGRGPLCPAGHEPRPSRPRCGGPAHTPASLVGIAGSEGTRPRGRPRGSRVASAGPRPGGSCSASHRRLFGFTSGCGTCVLCAEGHAGPGERSHLTGAPTAQLAPRLVGSPRARTGVCPSLSNVGPSVTTLGCGLVLLFCFFPWRRSVRRSGGWGRATSERRRGSGVPGLWGLPCSALAPGLVEPAPSG